MNKRAVIVGLFIFVGLAFLLGGILTIGNLHNTFVKKIRVVSIFDDVNGLQAGNNVWFSGVKIGTVDHLSFYGKSEVKVIFKVDEKAQQYIHKDAKVKISTDGLIGNKIIVIYGGTSASAAVQDGDTLGYERQTTTEDMMNTLQQNNKNLLSITTNLKTVSDKIAGGQGSIGKLLNDETLYNNIDQTLVSLKKASLNAQQLTGFLSDYTAKLNKPGSLANDLVTDTTVFRNVKATVAKLQQTAASANDLVASLNSASKDPNSPIGILLHDQQSGANLKATISNLDSSTYRLNQDLEGLQHSFPMKHYFKKKAKADAKAAKGK